MKSLVKYLSILSLLTFVFACEERFVSDAPCPCNDEKDVLLRLALPGVRFSTRSMNEAQENTIETLDVLAFKVDGDVEKFQYRVDAKKVTDHIGGNAQYQSFSVTLRVKEFEQRFVFISNARGKIEALLGSCVNNCWAGVQKEEMLSRLIFDLNGEDRWKAIDAQNFTAIPMWGESKPTLVNEATISISETPIQIMRMVAEINVQLKETAQNNFLLKSVYIYNTNSSGRIVPIRGNIDLDANMKMFAKYPSLPNPVHTVTGPLKYSDFSDQSMIDVAMNHEIYIFETQAKKDDDHLNKTCLVVGGHYDSDDFETFYRLDFLEDANYMDILRNCKYECKIAEIKGRGFPTVDDAFKSKPLNITTEILVWKEDYIDDVDLDRPYMLSVSESRFVFTADERDDNSLDNILEITADHSWEAIVSAEQNSTALSPVDWLSISPDNGAGSGQPETVRLYADENTGGSDRTAYIHIKAGRLNYIVTVLQNSHIHP